MTPPPTQRDPHDEERLRALLDEAVSDIEPEPALDAIRARTKAAPMSNRTWIYAVAAVAATAVTVTTVVLVANGDDDVASGPAAGGTPTVATPGESPAASESPAGTAPTTLPVYFVGDTPAGPRLYREFQVLDAGSSEADRLTTAVAAAVGAHPALDPDYRTAWPAGTTATVQVRDEEVWIDLSNDRTSLRERPGSLGADEAAMAVQQVIYTAHAVLQRRAPVQLTIDEERTDQVLGVPASEPLAAGEAMQVQAPVWIISPQNGDQVAGSFTVEGRGAFFEANVSWQLYRWDGAAGALVDEGFTTAEEGMTLSPYSFTVEGVEPGEYLLRVYDADMSGGEGHGEQQDTKVIEVR